jgi:guanylate kinase
LFYKSSKNTKDRYNISMKDTDKQYLEKLDEFKAALKDYQPSKENIGILKANPLVLLVGPTAAGRNTLINILVETGRYHFIVSDTTRRPRENNGILEQDGVEYWFKTESEFLVGLDRGLYLEAAIIHKQQVSGISMDELRMAYKQGKIAIDEVERVGAANVYRYKPDTLIIFLLPPTFDVWMERLRGRGHMPEDEVRRRLISAQEEIATALDNNYYQFVINNEVHEAATAVDELANGRKPDAKKQQHGRVHAAQLAQDVQLYLSK